MDIGRSIRKLRESRDLTQEQLGRIAGVSSMAVSQWENGRAVPRMGAIQRMADYFGIPKSEIMGDEPPDAVYEKMSADEYELLSLYRSMSNDMQRTLLETARNFAALKGVGELDGERVAGKLVIG